jgi:hypothetical protein
MSTDTDSTPPFNTKILEAAMAYTCAPPLLPVLSAIWNEAVDQLKRAEVEAPARLKKLWGKTPPPGDEFSALDRAAFAKRLGLLDSLPDDLIAYAYVTALKIIHRIGEAFYDLRPLTHPLNGEKPDEALMKRLLAKDNLKEQAFLDYVVPPFFALQLQAAFLRTHLNVPKGIPLSPAVLHDRASKGGRGANRGMEAVQEAIIQCLESASKGEMRSSCAALGRACSVEIAETLDKHRAELTQRSKQGEDVDLNYAFNISADGVIRKLPRWAKENPQLRERLAKLCKLTD